MTALAGATGYDIITTQPLNRTNVAAVMTR